jgi:hypothetical protein
MARIMAHLWVFFDDFDDNRQRLVLDEQTAELQGLLKRCLLFLDGDRPYEWPRWTNSRLTSVIYPFVWVATLGFVDRLATWAVRRQGCPEVWPFLRREDYEADASLAG